MKPISSIAFAAASQSAYADPVSGSLARADQAGSEVSLTGYAHAQALQIVNQRLFLKHVKDANAKVNLAASLPSLQTPFGGQQPQPPRELSKTVSSQLLLHSQPSLSVCPDAPSARAGSRADPGPTATFVSMRPGAVKSKERVQTRYQQLQKVSNMISHANEQSAAYSCAAMAERVQTRPSKMSS